MYSNTTQGSKAGLAQHERLSLGTLTFDGTGGRATTTVVLWVGRSVLDAQVSSSPVRVPAPIPGGVGILLSVSALALVIASDVGSRVTTQEELGACCLLMLTAP